MKSAIAVARSCSGLGIAGSLSFRIRAATLIVADRLAGPEVLARGSRSLISRAEERSFQGIKRPLRGEEAEAALFEDHDPGRDLADFDDIIRPAPDHRRTRRTTPPDNPSRASVFDSASV